MSNQTPTLLLSSYPVPQPTVQAVREWFDAPVRALAAAELRAMGPRNLFREIMRNPCRRAVLDSGRGTEAWYLYNLSAWWERFIEGSGP